MEEQRFLAAAIEDERIAPFETGNGPAFAGLLDEQIADRFLRGRVGRRGADLDAFGARPRVAKERRVDETIVEDDVGGLEAGHPAYADEPGIARPGADQIDHGARHRGET